MAVPGRQWLGRLPCLLHIVIFLPLLCVTQQPSALDGNGSTALAVSAALGSVVALVTVTVTAILVLALAALDTCLSPVWWRVMVCASPHFAVALAASDFGGTDGIGAISDRIGCSDLSGSGATAQREAEAEVSTCGHSLLFSSRYRLAMETMMRASPAAAGVSFSVASSGDCGDHFVRKVSVIDASEGGGEIRYQTKAMTGGCCHGGAHRDELTF